MIRGNIMEEKFFSGYCFQIDQARIVDAEFEAGQLDSVDCGYENCLHRDKCEIGKKITEAVRPAK